MTPLQFAKEQCANYRSDGGCSGIGVRDDGSIFMFGAKPACVLASNQPCKYLETSVLPMEIDPCNAKNVIRKDEIEEARKIYRKMTGALIAKTGRICPQCKERELEPRHRFCYECAAENRRKAKHAARDGSNGGS